VSPVHVAIEKAKVLVHTADEVLPLFGTMTRKQHGGYIMTEFGDLASRITSFIEANVGIAPKTSNWEPRFGCRENMLAHSWIFF
jgi:hypothetical protein